MNWDISPKLKGVKRVANAKTGAFGDRRASGELSTRREYGEALIFTQWRIGSN
jgi:hypothetical protein